MKLPWALSLFLDEHQTHIWCFRTYIFIATSSNSNRFFSECMSLLHRQSNEAQFQHNRVNWVKCRKFDSNVFEGCVKTTWASLQSQMLEKATENNFVDAQMLLISQCWFFSPIFVCFSNENSNKTRRLKLWRVKSTRSDENRIRSSQSHIHYPSQGDEKVEKKMYLHERTTHCERHQFFPMKHSM